MRRSQLSWLAFTALALAAAVLCLRLGFWQWHRGSAGQAQWERFAQGASEVLPLQAQPLATVTLYQRVRLAGHYDAAHQFLLDNRSWQGHPGYEVLTPFVRDSGATLLIDRGWVPFTGSRARLPQISLAETAPQSLSGRVADLPSAGLALGHALPHGGWPKVTAFPTMAELSAALGAPLEPRILLLDAQADSGYVRDWQAPGMSPLRHFSYAIQWWCFAALAVGAWAVVSFRRRLRGGR
jgi:surfeit locus 1 family protein